jgi:hypothetical protein
VGVEISCGGVAVYCLPVQQRTQTRLGVSGTGHAGSVPSGLKYVSASDRTELFVTVSVSDV